MSLVITIPEKKSKVIVNGEEATMECPTCGNIGPLTNIIERLTKEDRAKLVLGLDKAKELMKEWGLLYE